MFPVFQMFVRVFYHHHRRIDHGTDGNRDAAQRHDVGVDTLVVHDDEGRQYAQRQRDDGHQCGAQVKQKNQADHGHHRKLFQQLEAQIADGPIDQAGTVIDRNNFHPRGQAGLKLLQLGLDRRNGFQRVFARAHHDHAAGGFSFAIQLANAAPHLGAQLDAGHIAQPHRHARVGGHERHFTEVVERLQVA